MSGNYLKVGLFLIQRHFWSHYPYADTTPIGIILNSASVTSGGLKEMLISRKLIVPFLMLCSIFHSTPSLLWQTYCPAFFCSKNLFVLFKRTKLEGGKISVSKEVDICDSGKTSFKKFLEENCNKIKLEIYFGWLVVYKSLHFDPICFRQVC